MNELDALARQPIVENNPTLSALKVYLQQPQPGPNGPMPSMEQIQQHLSMTGQQYPSLYPVNQGAWDSAVNSWPQSINIDDRRGLRGAWSK